MRAELGKPSLGGRDCNVELRAPVRQLLHRLSSAGSRHCDCRDGLWCRYLCDGHCGASHAATHGDHGEYSSCLFISLFPQLPHAASAGDGDQTLRRR